MEIWTIWLIAAVVLLIVEILTQMMWALCLTAGAVAAMVCSLFGTDLSWQVVALVVVSLAAYAVLLPKFKNWHSRQDKKESRTGMDALLGRKAVVTQSVVPGRLGRARIDGDNWQVKAPGCDVLIPEGAEVVVTSYDSIILTVEPVVKESEECEIL